MQLFDAGTLALGCKSPIRHSAVILNSFRRVAFVGVPLRLYLREPVKRSEL